MHHGCGAGCGACGKPRWCRAAAVETQSGIIVRVLWECRENAVRMMQKNNRRRIWKRGTPERLLVDSPRGWGGLINGKVSRRCSEAAWTESRFIFSRLQVCRRRSEYSSEGDGSATQRRRQGKNLSGRSYRNGLASLLLVEWPVYGSESRKERQRPLGRGRLCVSWPSM